MSGRSQNASQFGSSKFVVYMFHDDYEKVIKDTVLKNIDLETGGDLFGLWTSEGRDLKPLVHIVLGPGEGCKRTGYSFFQDVPYLQRVGNRLANDYMLGHIGEWHSHHRLTLCKPSSGDYSTVIRNYPSGYHGFLLIIANILPDNEVTLSPFLFRENTAEVQRGNVVLIAGRSPFRGDIRIKDIVNQGAEGRTSLISTSLRSRVSTQIVETTTAIKQRILGKEGASKRDTTEQRSSTATETTPPNNGDAYSVADKETVEKGIHNEAMAGESVTSPGDAEGATSSDSNDVDMEPSDPIPSTIPSDHRTEDRDTEKLGEMFDGIKGITCTSPEPFSVSFTFSGELGKETATKMLSKLHEVTGDEKIKVSFAFNRNSNRWTVELPADHPRSPVTLQCVDKDADRQAKEEIQGENIPEIVNKIRIGVLRKPKQTYT